MIITDIIPVTKQKYKITTDEQLTFILYKGELSHYQLEKEDEIPENVWEEIYQLLEKRAKLRAMHLLTKMDYTEAELRQKLMQGGYTAPAVSCAIEYVKSFHYLDDKRYVAKYMEQPNKKSRRQKEFELERKGISKELIRQWAEEAAENEASENEASENEASDRDTSDRGALYRKNFSYGQKMQDETVLIQELLEKRCKNPQGADEKEKMKHYAYLARKGFSSSDIIQVFESYFR